MCLEKPQSLKICPEISQKGLDFATPEIRSKSKKFDQTSNKKK